jgi:hypothetical protein
VAKTPKIEKAVEIHEFYVIRTTSGSFPPLCDQCSSGDAFMVSAEQAAAVTHVPLRSIYRGVETGLVHYREAASGSILVCLKSLSDTRHQLGEALHRRPEAGS